MKRSISKLDIKANVPLYTGIFACAVIGVVALSYTAIPSFTSLSYTSSVAESAGSSTPSDSQNEKSPEVLHVDTPASVKGIYMSQCVVGTPSFRDSLISFIDKTELNSVVIDIKDFTGKISFPTDDPALKSSVSDACGAKDMKSYIEGLHKKGIYVIGRITVFQDPNYTKLHPEQAVQSKSRPGQPWKDYKGLSFIDVSSKPYWNYVVELSKAAHDIGFDEINYDYIRYPSDGPMSDAEYINPNKAEAVETFWKFLAENVRPVGVKMSADLFGYTAVNVDDLGIGQQLERALPYFDYIDPMVYPSHFNSGFANLKDVNSDPYKIIDITMKRAIERAVATTTVVNSLSETPIIKTVIVPATKTTATSTKEVASGEYQKKSYPASAIRPWLQSFDYPVTYTSAMVAAQIKATNDNGLSSWIFWDAANKYRALGQVLEAAQ